MGAAASGAHEAGARVTGVIPEKLRDSEGVFERCDEVIVTRDLRDRMERMAALWTASASCPAASARFTSWPR